MLSSVLLLTGLYLYLSQQVCRPDLHWAGDWVDSLPILNMDDAYRYFLSRQAWTQPALYLWNYVLPGNLLIDGLLGWATHYNLCGLRALHALLGITGLYGLYRSMRLLEIAPGIALAALWLLGLMPLFVFVSVSFLGELLLFFCNSWLLVLHLQQQHRARAACAAFLPFVRPDALLIIIPFVFLDLRQKNYKNLMITLTPGLLYFIFLLLHLRHPSDYWTWRILLRQHMSHFDFSPRYQFSQFLSNFSPFWVLPGLAGLWTLRLRRHVELWLGAVLSSAWFLLTVSLHASFYEDRYFVILLPALLLGWASLMHSLWTATWMQQTRKALTATLIAYVLYLIAYHSLQLDPLRYQWAPEGRWPVAGVGPVATQFLWVDQADLRAIRWQADFITQAVHKIPGITYLLINDTDVLYFLDPDQLPPSLHVGLTPVNAGMALHSLNGELLTLFPQAPYYQYMTLFTPDPAVTTYALFVGNLECSVCRPLFHAGRHQVYITNYRLSDHSQFKEQMY